MDFWVRDEGEISSTPPYCNRLRVVWQIIFLIILFVSYLIIFNGNTRAESKEIEYSYEIKDNHRRLIKLFVCNK